MSVISLCMLHKRSEKYVLISAGWSLGYTGYRLHSVSTMNTFVIDYF